MNRFKPLTIIFSEVDIKNFSKIHISLLILLRSEINMNDYLKVYLSTTDNVLIELNSHIDIPIELEQFIEMIDYLLNKLKIKNEKGVVLASIIKNKLNDYLPPNTCKLRLDVKGKKFVKEENIDSYTLYINLSEDKSEDVDSVRLSDWKMDTIGVCICITNIFKN